jgi:hypothetical protein
MAAVACAAGSFVGTWLTAAVTLAVGIFVVTAGVVLPAGAAVSPAGRNVQPALDNSVIKKNTQVTI